MVHRIDLITNTAALFGAAVVLHILIILRLRTLCLFLHPE